MWTQKTVHIGLCYVPEFAGLTVIFQARGILWVVQPWCQYCASLVIANVILEELQPETPPVKENNGCSVNKECSLMKMLEGI